MRLLLLLLSSLVVTVCVHSVWFFGCTRRRVDPTSEEDSYDDVLCVLELLSHLVTKDLVDQSDEPSSEKVRLRGGEGGWVGGGSHDLTCHSLSMAVDLGPTPTTIGRSDSVPGGGGLRFTRRQAVCVP